MDFGRQVGVENRPKIDLKRHQKSDEKKNIAEMEKSRSKTLRSLAAAAGQGPGMLYLEGYSLQLFIHNACTRTAILSAQCIEAPTVAVWSKTPK